MEEKGSVRGQRFPAPCEAARVCVSEAQPHHNQAKTESPNKAWNVYTVFRGTMRGLPAPDR